MLLRSIFTNMYAILAFTDVQGDLTESIQQMEIIEPGSERATRNDAGGMSFRVCDLMRLRRSIVLGHGEKGTYYSPPKVLNQQCVDTVQRLIANGQGQVLVKVLRDLSFEGRVAKQDMLLSVLAMLAVSDDFKSRRAAYGALNAICRIPTHLFEFTSFCQKNFDERFLNREREAIQQAELARQEAAAAATAAAAADTAAYVEMPPDGSDPTTAQQEETKKKKRRRKKKPKKKAILTGGVRKIRKSTGWGRMRRHSISKWYTSKSPLKLLMLMSKYKSRHDWSHKEVLTFAHPRIKKDDKERDAKDLVFKWSSQGYDKVKQFIKDSSDNLPESARKVIQYIELLEHVMKLTPENDEDEMVQIIKDYSFKQDEGGDQFAIVREHLPTAFLKSSKVYCFVLYCYPEILNVSMQNLEVKMNYNYLNSCFAYSCYFSSN